MNSESLAKKISKKTLIRKKECQKIVARVFELISKDLRSSKEVSVDGFGNFSFLRQEMKITLKNNNRKIVTPPKDIIKFELSVINNKINVNEQQ